MNNWWSQIKTAGSAIYANRHFLDLYRRTKQLDRLAKQGNKSNDASNDDGLICTIIGDVYIHPSANIHPTATVKLVLCLSSERFSSVKIAFLLFCFFLLQLGPNVSIGANVNIHAGVRIRESIILDNAIINDHTLVLHSIGMLHPDFFCAETDQKFAFYAEVEKYDFFCRYG